MNLMKKEEKLRVNIHLLNILIQENLIVISKTPIAKENFNKKLFFRKPIMGI